MGHFYSHLQMVQCAVHRDMPRLLMRMHPKKRGTDNIFMINCKFILNLRAISKSMTFLLTDPKLIRPLYIPWEN